MSVMMMTRKKNWNCQTEVALKPEAAIETKQRNPKNMIAVLIGLCNHSLFFCNKVVNTSTKPIRNDNPLKGIRPHVDNSGYVYDQNTYPIRP